MSLVRDKYIYNTCIPWGISMSSHISLGQIIISMMTLTVTRTLTTLTAKGTTKVTKKTTTRTPRRQPKLWPQRRPQNPTKTVKTSLLRRLHTDPYRFNSTDRQNPPLQQKRHSFWTNKMLCFLPEQLKVLLFIFLNIFQKNLIFAPSRCSRHILLNLFLSPPL